MIHYTCDCCKRPLESDDLRYVVKLEVYAAMDEHAADADDDRDHLLEIQEILQQAEDSADDQIGSDVYQQLRFDMCGDCRRKFMKNPLSLGGKKQFNFSNN